MIHFLPSPDGDAPSPADDSPDCAPHASAPQSSASVTPFTPTVSPAHRRDGWTAEKQIAFAEALAETACVAEACRRVGMSESSAYRLRRRPCGAPFRRAWDAALDHAMHRLEQAVLSRALHGVPRPVFYKGEQVGEYRDYDERLAMFLLRARRPDRYGGWINTVPAPDEWEDETGDPALRLDGYLTQIDARSDIEDGGDEDDDTENNARPTTLPASARDGA
jgi:hypothetical protein